MDKLTELGFTGLKNYFHSLSVFGYKSYKEVEKLLVLLFIEELLNGNLSSYITDDDYRTLTKVLYNLFGTSCLIPYPEFKCKVSFNQSLNILPRTSENDILRYSEDGIFRLANM